jgi:hypothetical protein
MVTASMAVTFCKTAKAPVFDNSVSTSFDNVDDRAKLPSLTGPLHAAGEAQKGTLSLTVNNTKDRHHINCFAFLALVRQPPAVSSGSDSLNVAAVLRLTVRDG